jgi:hypothetical protein
MPKLSIPEAALAEHPLAGGAWTLYNVPQQGTQPSLLWLRFKLMQSNLSAPKRTGVKRSFVLFWSPLEGRFARSGVRVRLEAEHPALYAEAELLLSLTYDRDWLERHYTREEIATEHIRLTAARAARDGRRAP